MKYEDFLNDLLRHTKRRVKLLELGAGAVVFLAALVSFLTLAIITDHALALGPVARWVVLAVLEGGVVVVLVLAASFVIRRLNDIYIARLIEKQYPKFRNTLVSYLEARDLPDVPSGITAFMEEQAAGRALHVHPEAVVTPHRLVLGAYALLAAVLFFFFYALFTHKSVTVALRRIWWPSADIPPATATVLTGVEPGSSAATVGSDIPVTAELRGVVPKKVTLRWSRERELWESLGLTPENEGRHWRTTLADVQQDFYYYVEAGDARSPTYHMRVVPTPVVTDLETRYQYPAYTRLPERVTYRGDVDALAGTVVTVRARTNTFLDEAHLLVNDVPVPAELHHPDAGEEVGDTVEAPVTVNRSGVYHIHLKDPLGFTNPDPPHYEILVRRDQSPTVRILEPADDVRLPPSEPLRLRFEASDDLGLAKLEFRYRLPGEPEERSELLPLPANVKELQSDVTVRLDQLGLQAGQSMACYLQATDTYPDDPHLGRSEPLVVLALLPGEQAQTYAEGQPPEGELPTEAEPGEEVAVEPVPVAREMGVAPPLEARPFDVEATELTLEELIARDHAVIDIIRDFLGREAAAQPAQPGEPGEGAAQAEARRLPTEAELLQAGRVELAEGEGGEAAAQSGPSEPGQGQAVDVEAGAGPGAVPGEGGAGESAQGAGGEPGEAAEAAPGAPGAGEGQVGEGAPEAGSEPGSGEGGAPAAGGEAGEAGGEGVGGEAGEAGAGESGEGGAGQGAEGESPGSGGTGEGDGEGGSGQGDGGTGGESGQGAMEGAAESGSGTGGEGAGGQGAGSQAQGSGSQGRAGPGGQSPGGGGAGTSPGGGDIGARGSGTPPGEAPELEVRPEVPSAPVHPEDIDVVGQIIEELFGRLLRSDINPELLEELNWSVQDLAVWVVTYRGKLGERPKEQLDEGVFLGEGEPGLARPQERVIEMGTATALEQPVVGEGTTALSPDELRELMEGAKGSISPEYRELVEQYYKRLSEAPP